MKRIKEQKRGTEVGPRPGEKSFRLEYVKWFAMCRSDRPDACQDSHCHSRQIGEIRSAASSMRGCYVC